MREQFLHYLWRRRRFDAAGLATTDRRPIQILHPGEPNEHAGPDFFNARLRIGDTEWAGNVEMHLRASEWLRHGHSADRAYDNVILHVVWENDVPVLRPNGEAIPCLVLSDRTPPDLLSVYERIENESAWIPCAPQIGQTPDMVRVNCLDRMLVERLEEKTDEIEQWLKACQYHWEEAFYRALARSFGLKVNAQPFEMLACATPLLVLAKHKNSLFQLEALLFGQAGMLENEFATDYPRALAKEYRFLRHKYGLSPIDGSLWKFLRLRPANFPSLRIAQFAALTRQSAHLFSKITSAQTLREMENLFTAELGEYWQTHYQFDRPSVRRAKPLGRDFIRLLLINTVVPFLFHYGKYKGLPDLEEKALRLLEEMPAEENALIDDWAALGMRARNAYQSQALIHLKTRFCDAKRCLNCAIGHYLLK